MTATLALAAPAPPDALPAAAQPGLVRCLWLALLLHLWLVVLVGTTPGPEGAPADGAGWALRIRLDGPGPAESPGRATQALPHTGPSGRAPEPRYGGAVRDAPPLPSPEPGAAQLGVWGPRTDAERLIPPAAQRSTAVGAGTPAAAPVLTRDDAAATPVRAPTAPSDPAPASAPEAVAAPPLEPAAGPSTAPRLAPHDTVEVPVLQRPERAQRDIAHTAPTPAAPPRPQPTPAPAPLREERLPALPAPAAVPPPALATVPPPAAVAEPPASPAPAPPPALPPVQASPPPPAAPAPVAIEPPPPVVEPPRPQPAVVPAPPVLTPPSAAPAPAAAEPAPPAAAAPAWTPPPVRRAPPAPSTVQPLESAELARTPLPDAALRAPELGAVPVQAAPRGGQPLAGARVGADRATPPAAAASAAPLRLELPAARSPQAGLVNPRLLNLVPPPPERKSALSEGIEKAARPDCRKAYGAMGPLAVLPLAADALRDGGCRW